MHAMVAWVDIGLIAMALFAMIGVSWVLYKIAEAVGDNELIGLISIFLIFAWIFSAVGIVAIIQGAWVTS